MSNKSRHALLMGMSTIERFTEQHIPEPNSGCWLWIGCIAGRYAQMSVSGKRIPSHRWSYEYFRGTIPPGYTLDHLCGITFCVNPDHLEPVSITENILRGNGLAAKNARKSSCPIGHEYDIFIVQKNGRQARACSICRRNAHRLQARNYRLKKKASTKALKAHLESS